MVIQDKFAPEIKHRLFVIINRLTSAGGVGDALTLAYSLSSRYEVTVAYGDKEKEEADTPLPLDETKIRFIRLPALQRAISPIKDFFVFKKLLQLFETHKPHIVHTHGFKPGLLGRIAAKRNGIPVIIHTYHGHVFHSYYNARVSRFICFIERKLAAISSRIIAISPQQAYELSRIYRIAPIDKISTIFIGISEENYVVDKAGNNHYRDQYGIPGDAIVIAIIGRLTPIKNHAFFVRIAKKLLEKNQPVFFFIIGDGGLKLSIQKELREHNISWQEEGGKNVDAHLFFTGWIENIATVLPDIDIVISTSLNEGTPVSLIEAQWFKKPVVATNIGGVRDALINNETGFLIDDFDINEFEKKVQLLIDNERLRKDMGTKGAAFVKERFSKKKETDAMEMLYENCLQKTIADQ